MINIKADIVERNFGDYEALVEDVESTYINCHMDKTLDSVEVIAKYEDAKHIIACLSYGFDLVHISEFSHPNHNKYNDEYAIYLDHEGIWCEPAKREKGYLYATGVVCYVMDNCNSKIISSIQSKVVYEVSIGNDDCNGDCDHCDCKEIDKDYYSINGKQVSQEEFEKKVKEIQDSNDLQTLLDIADEWMTIYKRLKDYIYDIDRLDKSFWY